MQDRPTSRELLEAMAELLEGPILDGTSGGLRHQVRVAANLARILEREAELAPELDERERELLVALLQGSSPGSTSTPTAAMSTAALNVELADRLLHDDGSLAAEARPALVEIVRGKLAVVKPGYDGVTELL